VPEKVKLPVLLRLLSAGAVMLGASGAVASTVKLRSAGVGSSLPAASFDRTRRV
jgi:hypothetical protein